MTAAARQKFISDWHALRVTSASAPQLERKLGVGGAIAIGLASMLGTGVFAAWTPALGWAGSWLLASLALAAVIAGLNAWSTAALARVHPQAGGAYAYGRARLGRSAGVIAGTAFVVGKVASAGAAALTIGAYLAPDHARAIAVVANIVVVGLDLRGVTRTASAAAVSATLVVAVLLVLAVLSVTSGAQAPAIAALSQPEGLAGVVAAAGLMFVAFAGYARIATLGEEVRDPARVIPRAMAVSLGIVCGLYLVVALVVLHILGPVAVRSSAPLAQVASIVAGDGMASVVRGAAVVAAGGALLSLLAGIGRTLFAMARGGDAPSGLTAISAHGIAYRAQIVAAGGATVVALLGGIGDALALSGVTILAYYGVAHLAALRLERGEGRPPAVVPVLGLAGCVIIAVTLVVMAVTSR